MNTALFELPGMECLTVHDEKTGKPAILFRSLAGDFATILKYNFTNLNDAEFWKKNAETIKTLLFNHVKFEDKIYETEQELLAFIQSNFPTYTPNEKLQNVLEYIASLTTFDGESTTLHVHDIENNHIWRKYYFQNPNEFVFYIQNLFDQGLISYQATQSSFMRLHLTLLGLTALLEINEAKHSRYCFVAMSFDKSLEHVYHEAIAPALNATNFLPFIVSDRHVHSEKTINDEIIAGLKKAHFTIADFTQHRAGVYFEAGYALGRGQKVIYTCRNTDISNAHFDTRNFQHIVWESTIDLREKLINKINAYVID